MKKSHSLDEAGLQRALALLRRVVREKGLRASSARERVALAALRYGGHFTVEDLVRRSKDERLEETHASTVYRTLPLLLEAGLLEEIDPTSGWRCSTASVTAFTSWTNLPPVTSQSGAEPEPVRNIFHASGG